MKCEDLFQAIGEIDESLLEEKKSRHWHIWTEIAAAIVICSVMLTLAVRILPDDGDIRVWHSSGPEPAQSVPAFTETETDLTAKFDTLEELEMQPGSILYLPTGLSLSDDCDLYITLNRLQNVMHIQVLTPDHTEYTDISGYGTMTPDLSGNWIVNIRDSQAFILTPMDEHSFQIIDCSERYAAYENLIITNAVEVFYYFEYLDSYWDAGEITSMEITRGRTGADGYEVANYYLDESYYADIVHILDGMPVYQYTHDSVETTCNLVIQASDGYRVCIGMPDILRYGIGWAPESGITLSINGEGAVSESEIIAQLRSTCFDAIKNCDPISTKPIDAFTSGKEADPQGEIISYTNFHSKY